MYTYATSVQAHSTRPNDGMKPAVYAHLYTDTQCMAQRWHETGLYAHLYTETQCMAQRWHETGLLFACM